jgi:hypothetical protein
MLLRAGFLLLAHKLQESVDAGDIWHNDLQRWLSDAVSQIKKDSQPYSYCYLVDFAGDSESGEVIYSCNGDTCRAPYEIQRAGDKISAKIDVENAVDVLPVTSYVPEADDDDHVASMEAAKLYRAGEIPLYERFISKAERKKASGASFAGKGKSFPILKPGDVMAAVRSMGRAGSDNYDTATLKKNIIRIAKEKGFASELPKAWQDKSSEAGVSRETLGDLSLVESAVTLEPIILREARADYEIKLIAPGKGATAFYPAEVLKRDGPKVFTRETHVYLNHPTAAEELQRPEGDVKNLAGVLTSDAIYHESHAKGPGLYARMKVFADHAQLVEEKAAHVGMSIRASGVREAGVMREGLPVLKQLVAAESVDVVTRAGAGGMILTEAATSQIQTQEAAMDAAELKKLQESITAQAAANAKLLERALRGDARELAGSQLKGVTLPEASKERVVEAALRSIPKTDAGELDRVKFGEVVTAEAKREGEYVATLTNSGRVTGMGSAPVQQTPEEKQRAQEAAKNTVEDAVKVFESMGMDCKSAEAAAKSFEEAA